MRECSQTTYDSMRKQCGIVGPKREDGDTPLWDFYYHDLSPFVLDTSTEILEMLTANGIDHRNKFSGPDGFYPLHLYVMTHLSTAHHNYIPKIRYLIEVAGCDPAKKYEKMFGGSTRLVTLIEMCQHRIHENRSYVNNAQILLMYLSTF